MLDSFPKHYIASARKNDAASGAKADALAPLGLYAGWPKVRPLRQSGKPAGRSVRLRKGRKGLDVRVHARGAMPQAACRRRTHRRCGSRATVRAKPADRKETPCLS